MVGRAHSSRIFAAPPRQGLLTVDPLLGTRVSLASLRSDLPVRTVQPKCKRTGRHEVGQRVTSEILETAKGQVNRTVRHDPGRYDMAGRR
jgi:hypothetical protein